MRSTWSVVAVVGLLAVLWLVSRWRRGAQLMRIGEVRTKRERIFTAIGLAAFLLWQLLPGLVPSGLLLAILAVCFALTLTWLMWSPPLSGHWSIHKKGIVFAEGPRPEFVLWSNLDRFEWQGDAVVVHRGHPMFDSAVRSHSLEVPVEKRTALEGILVTHLRSGR